MAMPLKTVPSLDVAVDRTAERVGDCPAAAIDVDGDVVAVLVLREGGLDVSLVDLVAAAGGLCGRTPYCHGRLLTVLDPMSAA